MIEKIKASTSEKIIFTFILILGLFSLTSFLLLKNRCLFVKNYDPEKIEFKDPANIVILNVGCGNVIIELYPDIIQQAAKNFSPALIANYTYDLVKEFNSFYQNVSILGETDETKKTIRVQLASKVAEIIKSAFSLLGIDVPNRM